MVQKTLSNTRARFQRLKDAKLFTGWIRSFRKNNFVVVTPKEYEGAISDEFIFQVSGPGNVAVFRAILDYCHGNELVLRLVSEIRFTSAAEDMRLLIEGTSGALVSDGCEFEVLVVDVSATGAAVIASVELKKGDPVELRIDSTLGQVMVKGEVKYCRSAEGQSNQFRIGMSLTPDNRVDSARWQRLLSSEAA
jgi:hypothetical protein